MTRDYAKPSTTRTNASRGSSAGKKKPARKKSTAASGGRRKQAPPPPPPPKRGKLFFVLALLIAGFGFGIYSLQKIPATMTPEPTKSTVKKSTATPAPVTKKAEPEQRFKFYDLLPESEVIPPKVDSYKFKEKSVSNDYYYMVQTGSFRSSSDAERQKATIAFQGLKANIKAIQNAQGTTWYRVITGPFYSRSEMNNALDKLVSIQIEPLVKKVKK